MKKILFAVLLTVAFALTSIGQEPCKRHVEPKGGFSFCPPEGWNIKDDPEADFDIVFGPISESFAPNIMMTELKNIPLSLKDAVALMTKDFPKVSKESGISYVGPVNQSDFTTSSKQPGIKLAFTSVKDGLHLKTVIYFFSGKGDNKILMISTALETQANALESAVERSMQTWQLDPLSE